MTLKAMPLQIISAPEVISALPELPTLADTTKNLYDCHYDKFFLALGEQHLSPIPCRRP